MDTDELLQSLARGIDTILTKVAPGTQFSLFLWQGKPENLGTNVNYVSNAQRETVKDAIQEVLSRWDTFHFKNQ